MSAYSRNNFKYLGRLLLRTYHIMLRLWTLYRVPPCAKNAFSPRHCQLLMLELKDFNSLWIYERLASVWLSTFKNMLTSFIHAQKIPRHYIHRKMSSGRIITSKSHALSMWLKSASFGLHYCISSLGTYQIF